VHPERSRLLLWLRRQSRERKAHRIRAVLASRRPDSVLLVGAGQAWQELHIIVERAAAEGASRVIALDLHAERGYLPWPYVRGSGLDLPFGAGSFDIVLSNAVIEHVGGESEQRRLVGEQGRVGRDWIVTTPNRWFPIEPHTATLFRHWGAGWRAAHHATITRALSRREFAALLPPGARVIGRWWSPTLTAISPSLAKNSS
jgi:hypothetical protein